MAVLTAISYSVGTYWIPNLEPRHDWHRFFFYCFVFLLTALVMGVFAVFIAISMPNEG